jgi:hypothetical protein
MVKPWLAVSGSAAAGSVDPLEDVCPGTSAEAGYSCTCTMRMTHHWGGHVSAAELCLELLSPLGPGPAVSLPVMDGHRRIRLMLAFATFVHASAVCACSWRPTYGLQATAP